MNKFLLFVWQLPQNILALIILFINRRNRKWFPNYYTVKYLSDRAVSLGNYILFDEDKIISNKALKHEQGHQKQSLYFGPLYLLVIGLPSIIGNILHRFWKFDYYKQPWEKWADRLGGVNR